MLPAGIAPAPASGVMTAVNVMFSLSVDGLCDDCTFTVTFPGGGRYDESAHAQKVAEHFGTEHHELPLPTAGLDVLRKLAHHLDEPFADPSLLPTFLISQLTRRHVDRQPFDHRRAGASITRARMQLGWEPGTSLREGLERQWHWFLEAQEQKASKA